MVFTLVNFHLPNSFPHFLLLKAQLGTPLYGRLFSYACASTEILYSTGDVIQPALVPAWAPLAITFGYHVEWRGPFAGERAHDSHGEEFV